MFLRWFQKSRDRLLGIRPPDAVAPSPASSGPPAAPAPEADHRMAASNSIRTDAETIFFRTETENIREHHACLVIIRGARLGARIVPTDQPIIIGRTVEADFQISARSVSRHHCSIFRKDGHYWVQDLGSTNHTYVNEKPVERWKLRDGDHVRISQTVLKFVGESNIEAGYHSELHETTVRDALTGLYNRRHAMATLDSETARCLRTPGRKLALIILDIDFFKEINDVHGHLAGDGVLKQVSRLAAGQVREQDTLARIGGEEFCIVLPDTSVEEAMTVAEGIRCAMDKEAFQVEKEQKHITLSAGVSAWEAGMSSVNDLIRAADENLYRAKSAGRNQVCTEADPAE